MASCLNAATKAQTPDTARSIDGTGNNVANRAWGAASAQVLRVAPVAYDDGVSTPAGFGRSSPRIISNAIANQPDKPPNNRNLTDWLWQWAQFLEHDITRSEPMEPVEALDIPVPAGDAFFDPVNTGSNAIAYDRTAYDSTTGTGPDNPRQQINQTTSYIDASGVYGSDATRAAWLRTGVGGRLKTGAGNLLPLSDGTPVNVGPGGLASTDMGLMTAGDVRANEHAGLIAVHTLFLREHNRRCDLIAAEHADWTDEQTYQRARKMVGALVQIITFNEFLPALLGPFAPDAGDAAYSPSTNATVTNVFANGIFRLDHTQRSDELLRVNERGEVIGVGNLPFADALYNSDRVSLEGGIEPILRGLSLHLAQEIDPSVVPEVRNFLFDSPGGGGFDPVSLNIQRGRDHGLANYNTVRETFGLQRVTEFSQITSDPERAQTLQNVYGTVNNIDVWVGAISEDHLPVASVGELATVIIRDQFTRLRDGDRFWYAFDPELTPEDVAELEATTLADVVTWNTNITILQDMLFFMPSGPIMPGADDDDDEPPPAGPDLCGALDLSTLTGAALGLFLLASPYRRRRR